MSNQPNNPSVRRYARVFLRAALVLGLNANVLAQTAPAVAGSDDQSVVKLDPFVSTGTRFQNRTVMESSVPIDIVNMQEMTVGGQTDMGSMLAASIPSLIFTPIAGGSDAAFARPIRLRGLASNQMLILVGGKRLYQSAWKAETDVTGSDINSLPPNAFASVEVLRDGASAQYGSDAISGVMNFILKRDTGYELSTLASRMYAGDGSTLEVTLDGGVALNRGGYVHASAYYRYHDFTNRQGIDKRQQFFGTRAGRPVVFGTVSPTDNTPVLLPGDAFDPREATFDRANNSKRGDARSRQRGIVLNGETPFGGGMTAYGYGGVTRRVVSAPFVFRRPLDNNNVREIYPNGFQPIHNPEVTDVMLSGGLKGRARDWYWDVSETFGRNHVRVHPSNTLNPSLGIESPTSFDAGGVGFRQALTMIDLTRSFNVGRTSPVDLALGFEYRWENYWIEAGEPDSYRHGGVRILDGPSIGGQTNAGSQGYPGFRPTDVLSPTRDNFAGYGELSHQLTRNWNVEIAGRLEHFSDAGDTATGKLATRLELSRNLSLRGSISNGFRSPSLLESYYSQSPTIFQNGISYITKHFPVTDPVAVALGAKPLEPETSVSRSLGATAAFLNETLTFSADAYQIDVEDQINRTSLFNDAGTQRFLRDNGFTDFAGASFFLNAIDLRTRGLDITGRYIRNLGDLGRFTITSALNFNQPKVKWIAPTPPQLAAVTTIGIYNQSRVNAVETGRPRRTFQFSVNYRWRKLELTVREVRYGETRSGSNDPALDRWNSGKWVTDLDLRYDVTKNLTVSVGANNAFDVYPDDTLPAANPTGLNPTSSGPFGFNGGFYFTRVTLHFK